MIRIDDFEDGIHWLSVGNSDEVQFYLRDGGAERINGPSGAIGWVFMENGERVFRPMGGDAIGEGAHVSLEQLEEVARIMKLPLEDLQLLAERDAKYF